MGAFKLPFETVADIGYANNPSYVNRAIATPTNVASSTATAVARGVTTSANYVTFSFKCLCFRS